MSYMKNLSIRFEKLKEKRIVIGLTEKGKEVVIGLTNEELIEYNELKKLEV